MMVRKLDLTRSQQTEIGQIIQAAQSNGAPANDTLTQNDDVMTTAQQLQVITLFSVDTATKTQSSHPYVIDTLA